MSSLKYIFVIQGNSLVRVPTESLNEPTEIEEKWVETETREEGVAEGEPKSPPSFTDKDKPKAKPRNKRN